MENKEFCYCGSGIKFSQCCQPFIAGEKLTETPEQTMRSRYSAFILREYDYIKKTWHPDNLPELFQTTNQTVLSLLKSLRAHLKTMRARLSLLRS